MPSGPEPELGPEPLLIGSDAHVFVDDLANPMIDDADLHHLARVLRLRPGSAVSVSDGRGSWCPARFTGAALLEQVGDVRAPGGGALDATIAFSLLKGDRNELVVQKLTEIGAGRIVPMTTERTIVKWDPARERQQLERLRRIAKSAAEQSRRVVLPIVEAVSSFEAAASRDGAALAVPGAAALSPQTTTVLIGPEGGWTPKEISADIPHLGLGPNILRAETGSIVACALLVAFLTGQVILPRRDSLFVKKSHTELPGTSATA